MTDGLWLRLARSLKETSGNRSLTWQMSRSFRPESSRRRRRMALQGVTPMVLQRLRRFPGLGRLRRRIFLQGRIPAMLPQSTPPSCACTISSVSTVLSPSYLRRRRQARSPPFAEYLSLSYQLETLLAQSLALANGKWRGQLLVEMDRAKKILRLKYWV